MPYPATFPTTPILDTFNRADENPLAGIWTTFTGVGLSPLKVVSNQVLATGANGTWNGEFVGQDFSDVEAYVTLPTSTAVASEIFLKVRLLSTGGSFTSIPDPGHDCYQLLVRGNSATWALYRVTNGSAVAIATFTGVTPASGHKIGVRCVGPVIEAWGDSGAGWVFRGQATDATWTHGAIGLIFGDAVSALRGDDFGGGNIPWPSVAWLTA